MLTIAAIRDAGWFTEAVERIIYTQTTTAYAVDFCLVPDKLESFVPPSPLVVFDEKGVVTLEDFCHPVEDATYLFGRSGSYLPYNFPNIPSVRIVTPGKSPLFGFVALGIVLEDRKRKWQCR